MRRVLITGANKGIGWALAARMLETVPDAFVLLGSRDLQRGEVAIGRLIERDASWSDRLALVSLDVSDDDSVRAAAQWVVERFGSAPAPLYGIVNNAGVGLPASDLEPVLQVNTYGMRRVCEQFLPLLCPDGGRVVNVTSAAGPNYVATCSAERQGLLINDQVTWDEIEAFMQECLAVSGGPDAFAGLGLGSGSSYGISKACANAYTLSLARSYPGLVVNACTPGFIETDLTRPIADARGLSPAEMGMKAPAAGTVSPLFLLFGSPEGTGHYYGSDALRSPLDRYRSPGDPPYTGD
ncbi:MAG: SDR family oxidoreductase [Deltaproteobacteria bacterium]|nr:SDR family oxidoreductase [Deltaproteobacteria bacterium]